MSDGDRKGCKDIVRGSGTFSIRVPVLRIISTEGTMRGSQSVLQFRDELFRGDDWYNYANYLHHLSPEEKGLKQRLMDRIRVARGEIPALRRSTLPRVVYAVD